MADFVQALDPGILLQVETGLSFLTTPFTGGAPYNFPLFLFGIYVQENVEAVQSLQTFAALLGASAFVDIFWMFTSDQAALMVITTILILLLKIPIFLSFGAALRQRGRGNFGGLAVNANDLNGPPVWSMPGGFNSGSRDRDSYQSVDEEAPPAPYKHAVAPVGQPAASPQPQSLSNLPPIPQAVQAAPASYQAAA